MAKTIYRFFVYVEADTVAAAQLALNERLEHSEDYEQGGVVNWMDWHLDSDYS